MVHASCGLPQADWLLNADVAFLAADPSRAADVSMAGTIAFSAAPGLGVRIEEGELRLYAI